MNTIQFLNEHSLEELEKKGVKSNYIAAYNFYILNYEQIPPDGAFPKNHPIIVESRNLVLRDKPWRIIGQSFTRFFNWNEDAEETKRMTDMMAKGKVTASEKLDGSLITVLFDRELDTWHILTRGAYADTNPFRGLANTLAFVQVEEEKATTKKISSAKIDSTDTFGAHVRRFLDFEKLDKNYTYVFEICTPGAHITKYSEESLTLLMVRDKRSGKEVPIDNFDIAPKPAKFTPRSIVEVSDMIEKKPIDFEGYVLSYVSEEDVIVDGRQRSVGDVIRMKVKSETYVSLHHLGIKHYNLEDLIRIVVSGEKDEVAATIPEYKDYLDHVEENLDKHVADVLKVYDEYKTLPRSAYAQHVKNHPYSWLLFDMFVNGHIRDNVKQRLAEVNLSRVVNSFKKVYYP